MPNNIQNAQPNTSAGNALLQNMLAGDTFTGKVMSIKDGMALLMLAGGNSMRIFQTALLFLPGRISHF